MANLYIKLCSDLATDTGLVLVNGSTTTYYSVLSDGTNLGGPNIQPIFTSSIDTYGIDSVGNKYDARQISLNILVSHPTSTTTLTQKIQDLFAQVDKIRRFGGYLRYKSANLSYYVDYKIEFAEVVGDIWDVQSENLLNKRVQLNLQCRPYTYSSPLDIYDLFTSDTRTTGKYNVVGSDWNFDSGNSGGNDISGGSLKQLGGYTGTNNIAHIGSGLVYTDSRVQIKCQSGGVSTSADFGVIMRRYTSGYHIQAYVSADSGGTKTLRIDKVVAGTATNLVNTAIASFATTFWVVGRLEGNYAYAEYWTTPPKRLGAATTSTSVLLTEALFMDGIEGSSGIHVKWNSSVSTIDEWICEPISYSVTTPCTIGPGSVIQTTGNGIIGDTEAEGAYHITTASTAPISAVVATYSKPSIHNWIWNGGAEAGTGANGWDHAAIAGMHGAGSSGPSGTSSDYYSGLSSVQQVLTTSADSGTHFQIFRKFKKGVKYSARCRLKRTTGSDTTYQIRLGHSSSDMSSDGSTINSSAGDINGWITLDATWTPTADRDYANFTVRKTAVTGATVTVLIDDALVYEYDDDPEYLEGGSPPFGIINASSDDITARGSFFTNTADANYNAGYKLSGTGSMTTNAYAEWFILPWTVPYDEFSNGQLLVDVFARVNLATTQLGVNVVLSTKPESGTSFGKQRYSIDYGSSGKDIPTPFSATCFRPVHLGTIAIDVTGYNLRHKLRVDVTNDSASTGIFGLDQLFLVPSRRFFHTKTGAPDDTNYADFISSSTETMRRVKHDLSSETVKLGIWSTEQQIAGHPDSSLLGSRIFVPTGDVETLVWLPTVVIDDPEINDDSTAASTAAFVHIAVQPRFYGNRKD